MPPPNLNLVTLIGVLAGPPSATQSDRTRVVALDVATQHGSERRLHRVVVADEFLGRELCEALSPGEGVHVVGELAYDAAGAHVLVAGRRGSDVCRIGGEASQVAHAPARAAVAAPAPMPVQQPVPAPRPVAPAEGFGGLAGLSDIAGQSEDSGDDDAPDAPATAPASAPSAAPVAVAPRTVSGARPAPAGAQPAGPPPTGSGPVPRTLPGARPTVTPPPPPLSPHAIHHPKPTTPPLRPPGQAQQKDPFAQQPDDGDIPF